MIFFSFELRLATLLKSTGKRKHVPAFKNIRSTNTNRKKIKSLVSHFCPRLYKTCGKYDTTFENEETSKREDESQVRQVI